MRIVIDLQSIQTGSRWRGIGRYSSNFFEALIKNRANHEIIAILNENFVDTIDETIEKLSLILPRENIKLWSSPGPLNYNDAQNRQRRQRAEQIYKSFISSLNPDVFLITSLFEGFSDDAITAIPEEKITTAVVLYDLIPLSDPDIYLGDNYILKSFYFSKIEQIKKAKLILSISQHSTNVYESLLGSKNQVIQTISGACDPIFVPKPLYELDLKLFTNSHHILDKYIITSGTIDENKNLKTLFGAFANLKNEIKERYQLVLVGHNNPGQQDLLRRWADEQNLKQDRLIITGYVTNDDLIKLYSNSDLMVFPSKQEGFGLPPLEAMSCGAPTIASRSSSLIEIIGLEEALFDPLNISQLTTLIEKSLSDNNFKQILKNNSIKQSQVFNWTDSAKISIKNFEIFQNRQVTYLIEGLTSNLVENLDYDGVSNEQELKDLIKSIAKNFPKFNIKKNLFFDQDSQEKELIEGSLYINEETESLKNIFLSDDKFNYVSVYYDQDSKIFRQMLTNNFDTDVDPVVDPSNGDFFIIEFKKAFLNEEKLSTLKNFIRAGSLVCLIISDEKEEINEKMISQVKNYFYYFSFIIFASDLNYNKFIKLINEEYGQLNTSKIVVCRNNHQNFLKAQLAHLIYTKILELHNAYQDRNSPVEVLNTHLFKKKELKILLIKLDHMGDLILSVPSFRVLRSRFPHAVIDIIVGSWNYSAATSMGIFSKVFKFDFFKKKSSEPAIEDFDKLKELSNEVGFYDIAIDLRRYSDTRHVLAAIPSDCRIGHETDSDLINSKLHFMLPRYSDIAGSIQEVNKVNISQQLIRLIDLIPSRYDCFNPLPGIIENPADEPANNIAIFPFSGNSVKNWKIENYLKLIELLETNVNVQNIFCFIRQNDCSDYFEKYSFKKVKFYNDLNTEELINELMSCKIVVANNSFGSHISSLLKLDTISIYGGQETAEEWSPCFGESTVLRRVMKCSPCHLPAADNCPIDLACLEISVDYVYNLISQKMVRKD